MLGQNWQISGSLMQTHVTMLLWMERRVLTRVCSHPWGRLQQICLQKLQSTNEL